MTAKTVLVLFTAVVGAVAVAAKDEPRDAFGVGILRRDGVIIPFATFDGRNWRNSWPEPRNDVAVPIRLDNVPRRWWGPTGPLETWQVWLESSERTVRVTQPDWVDVHCARHVALRTDYRFEGTVPHEREQPYPKDGLATSPSRRVERIEIVAPTADERQALAPVLRDAFNQAERELADSTGHPIDRRLRERFEPAVEAVYAFGESPRFYYIEALRAYRQLGQLPDECVALAFGTGWFVREGGKVRSLVTALDLLRCDRFGASYMLPLGVVRAGGRVFWLAQFSGWDHERYAVVEVTPKRVQVMVSAWGGGC